MFKQGSVLSPLLFIIVLEAFAKGMRSKCPEELFCADDLALVNYLLEGLKGKLQDWKGELGSKWRRLNV